MKKINIIALITILFTFIVSFPMQRDSQHFMNSYSYILNSCDCFNKYLKKVTARYNQLLTVRLNYDNFEQWRREINGIDKWFNRLDKFYHAHLQGCFFCKFYLKKHLNCFRHYAGLLYSNHGYNHDAYPFFYYNAADYDLTFDEWKKTALFDVSSLEENRKFALGWLNRSVFILEFDCNNMNYYSLNSHMPWGPQIIEWIPFEPYEKAEDYTKKIRADGNDAVVEELLLTKNFEE